MNNFFKKIMAAVLTLAIAISGIAVIQNKPSNVKAAVGDWELVWSDDFEGTSLNRNNWNVEVNGSGGGNNEKQYYVDSENNLKVSDGTLKIICRKENYGGRKYTSGRINSKGKQEFKYGRIEARLKLPRFSGIWPAFWMLGANYDRVGWPKCGEIDIMEAINDDDFVFSNLHWSYNNGPADTHGKKYKVNDRTQWHTYGMEWDENTAKFYVDDHVYDTFSITSQSQMEEFRKKQFIILNLAIGGNLPGNNIDESGLPATMEVDWVRVYQKEEAPTTKYDGPTVVVTDDAVASYNGNWVPWVSGADSTWLPAEATVTPNGTTAKEGFTVEATNFGRVGGDSAWTIQGQLMNLKYYAGATYTYKCTIESNVDKKVYVKVTNEGEENLAGGYIDVKAGVPYNYSVNYTVPEDYTDAISLKFGFGKTDGDTIADNASGTIKVSNVSFSTTTSIPDPEYTQPVTTKPIVTETTTAKPTVTETTTVRPVETTATVKQTEKKNQSPARAKINKVTRAKNNKKAKIKIKKVKGANGYQIQYSIKKSFKKKITKSLKTKYLNKTIKNLKAKKRYYIKVRAYAKNKGGNLIYGKWSKIKVLKVRK